MGDEIVTQAVLLLWGGIAAGLAIGGLLGWRAGFMWGLGVGCLVIGVGGLAGAGHLGWHRWQAIDGTVATTGVLLDFSDETVTNAEGRRLAVRVPLVRFVAQDGTEHRVRGLGGSQGRASPGDPVAVRYRPEDPSQAIVADAQNLWAGVWGLGMFGIVPLLVGIAATPWRGTREAPHRTAERPRGKRAVRAHKAASRARHPATSTTNDAAQGLTPRQQRAMTWSMGIGHVLMVASFVAAWLLSDDVGHAVAACFTAITPAFVAYGVGSAIRNGTWHAGVTLVMAALVFLLFAVGLWLFT